MLRRVVHLSVDKWHTDSVDYVYVLILSDITDMKGGELQVTAPSRVSVSVSVCMSVSVSVSVSVPVSVSVSVSVVTCLNACYAHDVPNSAAILLNAFAFFFLCIVCAMGCAGPATAGRAGAHFRKADCGRRPCGLN